MLLPTPYLDDRKFQDIVDELKSRIPLYCPEWTDHNVSDPGVTLIELFAYMAEQLIFRMNQVPHLHYMRFVQFLGIPVPTPQPAHVATTFWLARPLIGTGDDSGLTLPIAKGTEVSTTQTETTPPLLFSIEENARILTPYLVGLAKESRDSERQAPPLESLLRDGGPGIDLFSSPPRTGDTFTFNFASDLSYHVLQLRLQLADRRGTDIRTDQPPFVWEVFGENNEWEEIKREDCDDQTKGFNTSGAVRLFLPRMARLNGLPGANVRYGIRVRVVREEYKQTPNLQSIREVAALGITLSAAYQQEAVDEFLGTSDGSPGQRYRLGHGPITLPLGPEETLAVRRDDDEGEGESWFYVESFDWPQQNGAATDTAPKCFTVDVLTNEICLPPAIRRPDGEIVTYGAVPERNATLSMRQYRYGTGALDIERGAVNVLKTSIPYVDRVENRYPAIGGQGDLASFDALRIETQRHLRTGSRTRFGRAVTAEEFESLVLASFPDEVGKVECRLEQLDRFSDAQARLEHLTVYVTAKIPVSNVPWGPKDPVVRAGVIARIDQLLHAHRLLTSRVRASNPQFIPFDVTVTVKGGRDAVLEARIHRVAAAYLNPIYGGENGGGWRLDQLCTPAQLLQHLKLAFPVLVETEFRTAALEVKDPKRLFVITGGDQAAGVEALNGSTVGERLTAVFGRNGHFLSSQAKARVRSPGEEWSVLDSNRKYRLRSEPAGLVVYDYHDDPPEARLYILHSFQLVYE